MTAVMNDTDSPVVLITGGARRIGAAIARELHRRGCNLFIHYRSSARDAEALQSELNAMRPDSVQLLCADLESHDEVLRMAQDALQASGKIDGLVNNASSFYATPLPRASQDDWDTLINSNVKAAFFLSQQLATTLAQQHGSIVNITDMNADRGMAEFSIYTMAKSALNSMTRSLARELAPAVRVNAVAPGAILWPAHISDPLEHKDEQQRILASIPAGRLGSPEDIARAVAFLLLDAFYMTGQTVNVDGGRALA